MIHLSHPMAATRPSLQIRSSIYSNSEAFSSALLFCTHVEGRSPATPAKLCSSAPACVILSAVLQFADAGTARDVAAAFAGAIAPGSYLIISIGSGNRSEGGQLHLRAAIHPLAGGDPEFLRRP